jgi:PAS domain S-box-containing protein
MDLRVELPAAFGSTSRRKFVLTMVVALLLTGGMSLVWWLATKRAEADADRIAHTYAVKQTLEGTIRHLIDVENGARGYSFTAEDRFLDPIKTGRDSLPQDVATLRRLTADNPGQQRQLDALEPQIDSSLRFAQAMVDARNTTGGIPDTRVVRENNRLVADARSTVRRMQSEEDRLLLERTQQSSAARRATTLVAVGGAGVGLVLLVGIGWATHREIQVTMLNTELERRIEHRTADLRAERDERQKAEERLRLAVTGAGLGTWHWDLTTDQLVWSAECLALFGLPPDTRISYERFLASLHPDDRDRIDREVREALDRRREYNAEMRVIRPDGAERDLVSIGRGYYDSNGQPVRMEGIAYDVTERRHAEAALRASESRFRQLAEATPAMIWQVANDGTFTYVNERLRDYVGCETQHIGDWRETIHPEDLPRVAPFRESARTGRRLASGEFRVRRHDGEYRWFFVQTAPVLNSDGSAALWIGAATDIDDLKTAQQALVDANQRKDEFLATLAHELRNPLAPIRFALEGLKGDVTPDASAHARDVIERQVNQLVRLVEDLLDVSRITTSKIRLRREPVLLADLMELAREGAAPQATAANQRLEVRLPPPAARVDGDAARLVQVFANVLNNAVKFTPRGGQIWFTADIEWTEAVIRVRDTGIGIAPEALPHLFEMFHQEGNILDRSSGGLGIGLTLAHRLIEMHEGRIAVRSEGLGKGTEVEIRLPITTEARTVPAPVEHATPANSRPLRVEIVDDNIDAAEMLGVLVSGLGHVTKLAYDGPSALELADAFQPDVVLLDIGLPTMNGYAVAEELRRRPALRHVYLAALTGWGQTEDRRRAREAGFDTHFTKPVPAAAVHELLSAISRGTEYAGHANASPRTRFGDTPVV